MYRSAAQSSRSVSRLPTFTVSSCSKICAKLFTYLPLRYAISRPAWMIFPIRSLVGWIREDSSRFQLMPSISSSMSRYISSEKLSQSNMFTCSPLFSMQRLYSPLKAFRICLSSAQISQSKATHSLPPLNRAISASSILLQGRMKGFRGALSKSSFLEEALKQATTLLRSIQNFLQARKMSTSHGQTLSYIFLKSFVQLAIMLRHSKCRIIRYRMSSTHSRPSYRLLSIGKKTLPKGSRSSPSSITFSFPFNTKPSFLSQNWMLLSFQRIDRLLGYGSTSCFFSFYFRRFLYLLRSSLMADFQCNFGVAGVDGFLISFMEATELTGSDASEFVSTLDGSGRVLTAVPPEVEETCPSWKQYWFIFLVLYCPRLLLLFIEFLLNC